jgi:hypothetical protein
MGNSIISTVNRVMELKEDEMGATCGLYGRGEKYKNLFRISERKGPLRGHWCR